VLTDVGVLMVIEHVAMLLAMAGAMLLRPAEYAGHEPVAARGRLQPRDAIA
jgi:hypothetical protein